MAKYCLYCGLRFSETTQFCPECGRPMESGFAVRPVQGSKIGQQVAPRNAGTPKLEVNPHRWLKSLVEQEAKALHGTQKLLGPEWPAFSLCGLIRRPVLMRPWLHHRPRDRHFPGSMAAMRRRPILIEHELSEKQTVTEAMTLKGESPQPASTNPFL